MQQPLCFCDSTSYALELLGNTEIVKQLSRYPELIQIQQSSFQFKFVGAIHIQDKTIVVFPKNYSRNPQCSFSLKEARFLIRALLRYRNEKHSDPYEMSLLFGNEKMSSSSIINAVFILDDYCRNGYINKQDEIISTTHQGRILWNDTINKTFPLISNRQPVYTDLYMRHHFSNLNSPLYLIHRYVIKRCFDEWGWLLGYTSHSEPNTALPFSIHECVKYLNNELANTFREREILLIKKLIDFLSEQNGFTNIQKIDVIATPYFSGVWESICGFITNNKYQSLKELLPQPVWESPIVNGNISQRPDIFFVSGMSLYILDAKYYNYYHNLPGWHDVVKQFFYMHSMKSVSDSNEFQKLLPSIKHFYNAFLFPGFDDDCKYIGRVHIPKVTDLGEIVAFSVNQQKAIEAYATYDTIRFANTVQTFITEFFASLKKS